MAHPAPHTRQVYDKPNLVFKEDMVQRMVGATKDIRTATAKRIFAEQQFVAALESYTKALQGGLRMVNKQLQAAGGSPGNATGSAPPSPTKAAAPPVGAAAAPVEG